MTAVEVRYDGVDITPICVIAETRFTARTGGEVGDAVVVVSDIDQTQFFTAGKTLELYLDGQREWDGYLVSKNYQYWFYGHTANCRPCDHLTPRRIVLNGADRNALFTRRVLYDAVAPTRTDRIYAAGTTDSFIIDDFVTQYLNPHDGIDYATKVETVASPDPYADIDLPGPSNLFGQFMRQLSQSTGAVFYIDPDRYMVYSDVNTETGAFRISDDPIAGEIGCRDLTILKRADEMINDAMVWGAGQGVDHVIFTRLQDAPSIAAHGRWQNTGGFRHNLWKQPSADRIANSIIYGSPSNKRGHKDDAVSVTCTIFTPGLRVSDKVNIRSAVHGFEDVIPIREMTISFPAGPTNVQYDLRLSHEIDEPWTTNEYWWPPLPPTTEPRCPTLNCNVMGPIYAAGSAALSPLTGNGGWRDSHRVRQGSIGWQVKIDLGLNIWYWRDTSPNLTCSTHFDAPPYTIQSEYVHNWLDEVRYGGLFSFFPINIVKTGNEVWSWYTDYQLKRAGRNSVSPGAGVLARFQGTLTFISRLQERLRIGDAESGSHNPEPHLVVMSVVRPIKDPKCKDLRQIGTQIGEYTMVDGDSIEIDAAVNFDDSEFYYHSIQIFEPRFGDSPIAMGRASFHGDIVYFNRHAEIVTIGIPDCVEIPICGPACVTARRIDAAQYSVPVAFIAGSTQVWVDGLEQRRFIDYNEVSPSQGLIEILQPTTSDVYVCFDGAGYSSDWTIPAAGEYFIRPTNGHISGTFGAQSELWPSAVWHGQFYEHFHNGVDFGVGIGTPVLAAAAGSVVYEDQIAGGTMIHIYHTNGMRTTYAHLSSRLVADGSLVSQGDQIALSGDSGTVTGAHLHWGLVYGNYPEDPLPYTGA